MYFEIHKNPNTRQYRFLIKSANHQTLATSEAYASKQSVLKALEVIANGQTIDCFDKTGE